MIPLTEHILCFRVRYPEVDAQGFVHHSRYLQYFEMGRIELLRALGHTYADLERQGILFVVAKVECRYRAPARYDQELSLTTRIARQTTVRIDHAYELFPILRHSQFEDMLNHNFADPVSGLLRAIRTDSELECRVEIAVSPATHRRCHAAQWAVHLLERDFFRRHHWLARHFAGRITWSGWWSPVWWLALFVGIRARWSSKPDHTALETSTSRVHEREEDLQAAADKLGGHLFETQLRIIVEAVPGREREARERLRQMAGALGAFTRSRLATFVSGPVRRGESTHRERSAFLLSHEELATLWHPPTATAQAVRMQTTEFRELEAPLKFHSEEEGSVVLGRVRFRDDQRIVTLGIEDRRRHLYIVGKTGIGKDDAAAKHARHRHPGGAGSLSCRPARGSGRQRHSHDPEAPHQ